MESIQLVKDYKDDKFKLVYAFERDGDDVRIYEIIAHRMGDFGSVYAVEERTRDVRDILQIGLSKEEAIEVAYEYINGHLSYPTPRFAPEKEYYDYLQEELKEIINKLR